MKGAHNIHGSHPNFTPPTFITKGKQEGRGLKKGQIQVAAKILEYFLS